MIVATCPRHQWLPDVYKRQMYDSYIDLAAYLTVAAEFDAQSMMICLQCINDNMDDSDSAVKNAYFTLYSYMVMRKGFWKDGLYRGKTIKDLAMEAYDTWKEAQKKAKKKNSRAEMCIRDRLCTSYP